MSKRGGVGLTEARKRYLEWLDGGPRLVSQIEATGSRVPGNLRRGGLIKKTEHPTVKDPWGFPADAYEITEKGRATLKGGEDAE